MDADKPVVAVHLDDEPLPSAIRFVLGNQQALMRAELERTTFYDRLIDSVGEHIQVIRKSDTADSAKRHYDSSKLASIAVLPFEVQGDDHELLDYADFCAEELCITLGISNNYRVVPRSLLTRELKNDTEPSMLGEKLSVRWLVSCALRRRGENLHLNVEMIDTESASVVWNNRLRVPAAGGEDYVKALAWEAKVAIEQIIINTIADESADCADDELDVMSLCNRANRISLFTDRKRALTLLERAMTLAPLSPWPPAVLARSLALSVSYGLSRDPAPDISRVHQLVELASRRGRQNAAVLDCCSWACWNIGEHSLALQYSRQTYTIADTYLTKMNLTQALVKNGLAEEALQHALEQDKATPPGYMRPHPVLRDCYCLMEDWEKALEHARQVSDWGPDFFNHLLHSMILAELDRIDEAKAQIVVTRQTLPKLNLRKSIAGMKLAFNNQPQFYRGLEKLIELGAE